MCLSISLSTGGGGGGAGPRYLLPPPRPGQDGGGSPRYLPPSQVRMGEGVSQDTYPPARSGRGYPKVPTAQPGQDGGEGTPRFLHPLGQGLATRRTVYSCVHAGGLSCLKKKFYPNVMEAASELCNLSNCCCRFRHCVPGAHGDSHHDARRVQQHAASGIQSAHSGQRLTLVNYF